MFYDVLSLCLLLQDDEDAIEKLQQDAMSEAEKKCFLEMNQLPYPNATGQSTARSVVKLHLPVCLTPA